MKKAKRLQNEAKAAQKNGGGLAIPAKACFGGKGSFKRKLNKKIKALVDTLPPGAHNVVVEMKSGNDIDLELWHGTKEKIAVIASKQYSRVLVNGKRKKLKAAGVAVIMDVKIGKETTKSYKGMSLKFSGDDTRKPVKEWIKIDKTTIPLKVKAYAFQAGTANVVYKWGPDPAAKAKCIKDKTDEKSEKAKAKKIEKTHKETSVKTAMKTVAAVEKRVKAIKKEKEQCKK